MLVAKLLSLTYYAKETCESEYCVYVCWKLQTLKMMQNSDFQLFFFKTETFKQMSEKKR